MIVQKFMWRKPSQRQCKEWSKALKRHHVNVRAVRHQSLENFASKKSLCVYYVWIPVDIPEDDIVHRSQLPHFKDGKQYYDEIS